MTVPEPEGTIRGFEQTAEFAAGQAVRASELLDRVAGNPPEPFTRSEERAAVGIFQVGAGDPGDSFPNSARSRHFSVANKRVTAERQRDHRAVPSQFESANVIVSETLGGGEVLDL